VTQAGPGAALRFVTGNAGKARELRALLAPRGIDVVQDARGYPELQAGSLAEVTDAGADHLLASGLEPPFVLEDSGLFVDALRGFPGVYSRHALDTVGVAGLLRLLDGVPPPRRTARFATDLLLVEAGGRRHFEGVCEGTIAAAPAGDAGFGFDPVFVPAGHSHTFAQMDAGEKNRLSHRGQAVRRLLAHPFETAKP
jgi:XTP/dITP diphosphohydrolase